MFTGNVLLSVLPALQVGANLVLLPLNRTTSKVSVTDMCAHVSLFIYLFLAALGLRCCMWAFSSCSEWGLLFFAVHGLLIVVVSLVAEHGL